MIKADTYFRTTQNDAQAPFRVAGYRDGVVFIEGRRRLFTMSERVFLESAIPVDLFSLNLPSFRTDISASGEGVQQEIFPASESAGVVIPHFCLNLRLSEGQ